MGASVPVSSPLYHLTLHNLIRMSTKWRRLWRPNQSLLKGDVEDVTRHLHRPASSLFFCLCGEKRTKLACLGLMGFCLHFPLLPNDTMVIGRSGCVCIWCSNSPPRLPPSNTLHLPSPHPVESSLKDLLLMSYRDLRSSFSLEGVGLRTEMLVQRFLCP